MPISTNEIQGHKEMSTLPLVETTQPNNTINESSDNQFHWTLTSEDQLPKIITIPSINKSTNNYTQIISSNQYKYVNCISTC